ncbi:hypothetical protein EMIHUDRAFT_199996 [Emiliania huxleyi CCMP1516]|uniref:PABC domain-containing protein n=2 Tax=Emiliania huxleyi TaxID=2903 RepID=A0A0D3IGC4_EMIH1|nr:hypothetical protein EMIHUDRAFT_248461 [Emiliania huxleyi CCMP1516]XP_005791941.1 hypothetical protein EMIHUDRAFT_199996 [Emiliania huxleyi CCMP1516]EOD10309.1 hypothetical protein EMIHUDRAFT_248461 [Emiliania huxleyi CCMP1516]EOD39512.1 hypothetical protein EMIHUDRAFT_199996 [Emiliania huxleyi CCMP1516]|eukprot:XP_005762738.1 hypothetical protein EMIHUDRAFT_248461 [Emiliania huxleyi CCMP1516]
MPVLADQVYALGESLYELIYSEAQCDDPAKVTGMLLQLDADAVRSLIASPERRSTMVAEAVAVLKAATASHDNPSSDCYRSSHGSSKPKREQRSGSDEATPRRPEGLTVSPAPAHGGASTSAPGVIQLEAAPAEGGETVSDTAVAARAARCGSQAPANGSSTGALASGPLPLREALRRAQGLEREVRREVERYALGEDNLKRLVEERGGTFRAAVARAVVDKIAEFILVAKRRRRDKSYALRATAEVSAKEACANLETLRKNLRKQAEGRRWK